MMILASIVVGVILIWLLAVVAPLFWNEGETYVAGFGDEFDELDRELNEPIVANYKHGWMINTKAGDKVKIVAILNYQFEEIGEPYYFVQSKKTGISYHVKESEIKPKGTK